MDTQLKTGKKPWKKFGFIAAIAVSIAGIAYLVGKGNTFRVEADRLSIARVEEGRFYEYINLNGRVAPGETYLIDSRVAGNVEEIYVESGQEVERGDTLLRISNADLELEVMQRESQLIEQLNAQRQTRLLLDQNDFMRRDQLTDTEFQLSLNEKQATRRQALLNDGIISESEYEPTANRYAYLKERRRLLTRAYRQDSLSRRVQLRQIDDFESRILANLEQVRAILDRLYVTAATGGKLSDFDVRTGEAITAGQRLGEIYSLAEPVLVAEVDEFYLDRVYDGQKGILLERGDSLDLRVGKIYPDVESGRFRVEVKFAGDPPVESNFTKGQSLRLRLLFGQPSQTKLLAAGGFYASTGGHWVYRLQDGRAVRTSVRLGRSNPNYYEVLEGLQPGDRVIVSGYDDFADYQSIQLK